MSTNISIGATGPTIDPLTHYTGVGANGPSGIYTTTNIVPATQYYTDTAMAKISDLISQIPVDTIKGDMITAQLSVADHEYTDMTTANFESIIKKRLTEILAEKIMNHISFTYTSELYSNSRIYKARCFLTPSDQVQTIKKHLERK